MVGCHRVGNWTNGKRPEGRETIGRPQRRRLCGPCGSRLARLPNRLANHPQRQRLGGVRQRTRPQWPWVSWAANEGEGRAPTSSVPTRDAKLLVGPPLRDGEMTAEIAVLNKLGVALAADSIVTITSPRGEKTYNTSNKLFTLSKRHPVGGSYLRQY